MHESNFNIIDNVSISLYNAFFRCRLELVKGLYSTFFYVILRQV